MGWDVVVEHMRRSGDMHNNQAICFRMDISSRRRMLKQRGYLFGGRC